MITSSMAYSFVERWAASLRNAKNESHLSPVLLGMQSVYSMAKATNPVGDVGEAVKRLGEWVVKIDSVKVGKEPFLPTVSNVASEMESALSTLRART